MLITDKKLEKIAAGEVQGAGSCQFPMSKPFDARKPEFCEKPTLSAEESPMRRRSSYCFWHHKKCYSVVMGVR